MLLYLRQEIHTDQRQRQLRFAYAGADAIHLRNERSANAIKYKLIYAQSTKHKYFHLHKITKTSKKQTAANIHI